ncbi:glutaredoxin 3 [Marinomonas dokdonensis]|uniref:glutaredoxin 3 n=1 Tax=Marinomonas dokdonensis TaxID=328224 RepID=UPI0040559A63
MANVTIYSSNYCPFCIRAKQLLSSKKVKFHEINVDGKPSARAEMTQKSGRTSVPQIWIDNLHVGGCDDLYALQHANKLDDLLAK